MPFLKALAPEPAVNLRVGYAREGDVTGLVAYLWFGQAKRQIEATTTEAATSADACALALALGLEAITRPSRVSVCLRRLDDANALRYAPHPGVSPGPLERYLAAARAHLEPHLVWEAPHGPVYPELVALDERALELARGVLSPKSS